MTVIEEQKIIQRVLDGDRNAFEVLVLANHNKVYNLALRVVGDWSEALDVSQEAFLRAYQSLGDFRGDCRFTIWLYRLTYNMCIDFLRKKYRNRAASLTYHDENNDTKDIEIHDVRNLPEDVVLSKEIRGAITDCILELQPMHRDIIYLREITGMSYNELATTLNINEGTVKSRLARARICLITIFVKNGTDHRYYSQNDKDVRIHTTNIKEYSA
ncbi:MAG: sigma-70 family RNA polymerase sigma factor [Oscillospiraceae bacterium]|nr:sigma-70 family RNA polymerase sigma factor [Oscillospiraceae bacterium]